MRRPTESTEERYAAVVPPHERASGPLVIATLIGMLLVGVMLAVLTQGWWGTWGW